MKYTFLGKTLSGPFTIPSGIVTTNTKVIERIARLVPEIGVITTKSIGPVPREGYREPILTQYAPGCFMNAVGLTNPGAEDFATQLKSIRLPDNRFLLASVFGKDEGEFVSVAKTLAPHADGLELNLSCPHAQGYGMAIGQDPQMVESITRKVKQAVSIPVIPKLTPNTQAIADIARAAMKGGADALCAINTVGPGYYTVEGVPVLTFTKGGMSGKAILPLGLKCVKDITDAVPLPIIGCGGISTAADVRAYADAGASIFGVGSALAGMGEKEITSYFAALHQDYTSNTKKATTFLKQVDMQFSSFTLAENKQLAPDLSLLVFDRSFQLDPGQFVFVGIPGEGEKPFSVLDEQPLTLLVQKAGCFTEKLLRLKKGEKVYIRGPYGIPITQPKDKEVMVVGGGCGFAAVYPLGRDFQASTVFVGARDANHLFYIDEAKKASRVLVATDDGSQGFQGFVSELLHEQLKQRTAKQELVFYNCGPKPMIDAVTRVELLYTKAKNIFSSIEEVTKCGVGLCGSCATKHGKRLCVDGPFIGEHDED